MNVGKIFSLIDAGLESIEHVSIPPDTLSLSLHHNNISFLFPNSLPLTLVSLELSSNRLTNLIGVRHLQNLTYLNLSANLLVDLLEIGYLRLVSLKVSVHSMT